MIMILFITKRNYTHDIYVYVKKVKADMVDDSTNINKTNYHPPKSLKTKKAAIYSLAWHWIAKKRWRIKN